MAMTGTGAALRAVAIFGLCVVSGGATQGFGFSGVAQAQENSSVYAVQRQYASARSSFRMPSLNARSFFGLERSAPVRALPQAALPAPAERRAAKRDKRPAERMDARAAAHAPTSYCVRQCDGFFFPLAGSAKAQAAMCRDGDIYTAKAGGNIDTATNDAGQSYSAMPMAFAFRSSLDNACTGDGGAAVAVYNDPTLRAGDMVMTDEGLKVFRGGSMPHSDADFRSATSAKLSSKERQWVAAVEAASARHSASPSQTLVARLAERVQRNEARAIKASAEVASADSDVVGAAGIRSDVSALPVGGQAVAAKAIRYVGPDLQAR